MVMRFALVLAVRAAFCVAERSAHFLWGVAGEMLICWRWESA